ncbi:hypothetical protein J6590_001994 [Homalodisca vitripennis]|nr:hypothetical protein J6590_001994 [Homalodisca vitripennis]
MVNIALAVSIDCNILPYCRQEFPHSLQWSVVRHRSSPTRLGLEFHVTIEGSEFNASYSHPLLSPLSHLPSTVTFPKALPSIKEWVGGVNVAEKWVRGGVYVRSATHDYACRDLDDREEAFVTEVQHLLAKRLDCSAPCSTINRRNRVTRSYNVGQLVNGVQPGRISHSYIWPFNSMGLVCLQVSKRRNRGGPSARITQPEH